MSTSGSLQAVVTVDVGSQVSGRIQDLYADFNSQVKKGQRIAKIDPSLFEAQVVSAEANVAAARAERHAARRHGGGRRASGKTRRSSLRTAADLRDRARQRRWPPRAPRARRSSRALSQLAQSSAALETARTNLRYTDIVSPTDGVVISRAVNLGQTVAASLPAPVIFTIAQDLRKMEVHTNVAESDIGRLKPSMRVTFTVDAYPGDPFRGRIRDIRNAPQIVQNVVTYDAVIDVDNAGSQAQARHDGDGQRRHREAQRCARRAERGAALPARRRAASRRCRRRSRPVRASGTSPARRAATATAGASGIVPGMAGRSRSRRRGSAAGRASSSARSTSWSTDEPEPREVITGLTDGRLTEITGGELKEGEQVIVGVVGQGQGQGQRGQQRGPRIL